MLINYFRYLGKWKLTGGNLLSLADRHRSASLAAVYAICIALVMPRQASFCTLFTQRIRPFAITPKQFMSEFVLPLCYMSTMSGFKHHFLPCDCMVTIWNFTSLIVMFLKYWFQVSFKSIVTSLDSFATPLLISRDHSPSKSPRHVHITIAV